MSENKDLCAICDGHGRYQDGDSGTESDGYAPTIVECDCTPDERSPAYALRGLYKLAMDYFIDGKPCTPDEYIQWQAGIIEALISTKIPEPKYYGGSAEEGDQHEVKCAYVDGWNDCRSSIMKKA